MLLRDYFTYRLTAGLIRIRLMKREVQIGRAQTAEGAIALPRAVDDDRTARSTFTRNPETRCSILLAVNRRVRDDSESRGTGFASRGTAPQLVHCSICPRGMTHGTGDTVRVIGRLCIAAEAPGNHPINAANLLDIARLARMRKALGLALQPRIKSYPPLG